MANAARTTVRAATRPVIAHSCPFGHSDRMVDLRVYDQIPVRLTGFRSAVHFRKLTELTPNDPKAWYGLGKSYESASTNAFETGDPQSSLS